MYTTRSSRKERIAAMPYTKISSKRQITIPKTVFDALNLETGDILEVRAEQGKAVVTPAQLVTRAPAPRLSAREQQTLARAKKKIAAIREDLVNARGLTRKEVDVAARMGLIDPDQKYWWTEEWQKDEREAERDIRAGRVETFETPEEFRKALQSL